MDQLQVIVTVQADEEESRNGHPRPRTERVGGCRRW